MVDTAASIWRDFVTDGVPSSGTHEPQKAKIREWGSFVELASTGGAAGAVAFPSKAVMDVSLDYGQNTLAWVVGDATAANNGVYRKDGASGSGSWSRIGDLPYGFIAAINNGTGTSTALVATTTLPIPDGSALVSLPIAADNEGSPVTVAFNGGSPLTIKTASGSDVATGGLLSGMIVLGIVQGSEFRLLSDQASSAIQAAAEDAVAEAEAIVASLSYNAIPFTKTFDGIENTITLPASVTSADAVELYIGESVRQKPGDAYTVSGDTVTLTFVPDDGDVGWGYVKIINEFEVGVPDPESVGATEIKGSDIAGIRTKLEVYSEAEVDAAVAAAAARGHIFGLTLSNNTTDATNDIDIAAGEAASREPTPVRMVLASALVKRLDADWAAGTGQGMRYSGAAIADGTYGLFAGVKADGTDGDVYAYPLTAGTDADSIAFAATVLAAWQAETGGADYAHVRRVGSIIRASSVIRPFWQRGDVFTYRTKVVARSSTALIATAEQITLPTPIGIRTQPNFVSVISVANNSRTRAFMGNGDGTNATVSLFHDQSIGDAGAGALGTVAMSQYSTDLSARVYYAVTTSAPVVNELSVLGWIDDRGRNA